MFTNLRNADVREITSSSHYSDKEDAYFPEGLLAQWFVQELKEEVPVYMFSRNACIPVHKAYEALVKKLNIDT
jgi:hypothetical protein